MKSLQFWIVASRIAFIVVQFGAIAWIVWLVDHRTPPAPVAASNLLANHRLAREDFQTTGIEHLLGGYLTTPVEAGKPIYSAMVSQQPISGPLGNALVAVVTIPLAIAQQRGIAKGKAVFIERKMASPKIAGIVVRQECDQLNCELFVSLSEAVGPTIDPGSFAAADLVTAPAVKKP